MEEEFECTKIKDGLYLGNLAATQDYEFLQINKFSYVVNCSAEVPNYFDTHGVKYLKFKLIKERTHKLWDESLKKLRKLEKFIEEAEQQSLCCIIFSAGGNNRSLAMLTAFLMSKYRWNLSKTLEYVRSKKIYIGLSEHYIEQLQMLEKMLNEEENKQKLTSGWRGPYFSDEEDLISKTYLNSQELPLDEPVKKEKKEKRVVWQDRIEKERKKQMRENKMRQTGLDNYKKIKSTHKFTEESANPHNSLSTKALKNESMESPLKKPQGMKKLKKSQKNVVPKMQPADEAKVKGNFEQFEEVNIPEDLEDNPKPMQEAKLNYFSQKQLLRLINKNLKVKKEMKVKNGLSGSEQLQNRLQKGIYKLTINNFISPNINIMNTLADRGHNDKPVKSVSKNQKKEDRNGRTQSEKETFKSMVNDSLKMKPDRNGKIRRNNQNSPRRKEKKLEKAVSLQFKKNN